jgi:cell division protein FtsA
MTEPNRNHAQKQTPPVRRPEETGNIKVALDVGTTKVIAIAGRKNQYGKLEILAESSLFNTGVVQGEIFNLLKTSHVIRHVMDDLEKKYGIQTDEVSVGLSGDHIRIISTNEYVIRENEDEIIGRDEIKELFERAKKSVFIENFEEILEIIPQGYRVDNSGPVQNPVGYTGRRLEGKFLLVIGNTRKIRKLKKSIEMAGLKTSRIYLQSMASAYAVLNKSQMDAGTILVDIGGGTSDVIIMKNGIVQYTGVIPYGGDYITQEIVKSLHLLPRDAEFLKIKNGSAYASFIDDNLVLEIELPWNKQKRRIKAKLLASIIQTKMEHIASLILNHINRYNELNQGEILMAGSIITGGGALLKHIKQFMQYKLGMEVELGNPNIHLDSNELSGKLNKPIYSTVIGLLKMHLDEENGEEKKHHPYTREGETAENTEIPGLFDNVPDQAGETEGTGAKSGKGFFNKLTFILNGIFNDSK